MKTLKTYLKEDQTDDKKMDLLEEIEKSAYKLMAQIGELEDLDRAEGASGAYDLADQITTMDKHMQGMIEVIRRGFKIVPTNEFPTGESVGENPNMQGSNMGGMNIQNLRKNAGLYLDPIKETNDQKGEYYNDDLEGTIEWEMVDVDRGFGSEGQDFFATITTEDGVTRELDDRELEDAEEHVRDDMQGAHDDAGDAAQHAHSDELSILKRNAGI